MSNARGTRRFLHLVIAIQLVMCSFMPCMALPQNAWAASDADCAGGTDCQHEAAIGNIHYDTLAEAITDSVAGDTVELLRDVEHPSDADPLWIRKNITVDLNSHLLSSENVFVLGASRGASVLIRNGSLSGGISGAAYVLKGVLQIDKCEITTDREGSPAIFSYGANNTISVKNSVARGKNCFALHHNGRFEGFTVTAENTRFLGDVTPAVYISGSTKTTEIAGRNQQASFTNCTIIGTTGIEGKFTDITLTGCTVEATAETPTFEQFNNGSTTDGFSVVSTDNTMKPNSPMPSAKIKINSGFYSGLVGLSQLVNTSEYPYFKEANYEVSGGIFSSDPAVYLSSNRVARVDSSTSYEVIPKSDLNPGTYKTAANETIEAANLADRSCPKHVNQIESGTYVIGGHEAAAEKEGFKAATCTESGYSGDTMCSDCYALVMKGEVTPAAGHKFSGGKCTVCGIIDPTYATISVIVENQEGVGTPEQAEAEQVAAATASSVVQAALGLEGAIDPVGAGIVSKETFEAVKEAVDAGIAIEVVIESEPVSAEAISAFDRGKIVATIGNGTIAQYIDLSVILMANDEKLGTIQKLEKPVKYTIAIPPDLIKDGRTFYVVRVHDGVAEKLPTTTADGFATFETDRFSTYALVYEEASGATNTGDTTSLLFPLILVMVDLAAILCIVMCRKRRME